VTDLLESRVAGHQEHVTCDTVVQHLFTRDSIVAESQKDPADIRLNLNVVKHAQAVEQGHNSFLNQQVDRLLGQGEVH
jgi:hypothetical protein